jgi:glycosyltransferase involved in cell wall biosynthesis
MIIFEVFVPTYNRPVEFEKCLRSIENALLRLTPDGRLAIGVAINDNSTDYLGEYEAVVENFQIRFKELGVSYFDYRRTGFNIGGISNIVSGIYAAKSEYVWCLPDDDLARFDSLSILLSVIQSYRPNFISGAWCKKSVINYDSDANGDDDGLKNKVLDVIVDREKVSSFLSKNVVQLQEYVYRAQLVKDFLKIKENRSFLNDMFPGLLALVCLRGEGSFVRLERSVGIFRDGDPRSEWRHLWVRLALIEWPQLCEKLFNRGWLSFDEYRLSVGVFRSIFDSLSKRPDILLGLNRRQRVNPFLLFKYHRSSCSNALLMSPISITKAIFKKIRQLNK